MSQTVALGEWTPDRIFHVSSKQTQAYAAATNDETPRYSSGELAPPVFSAVVAAGVYREALDLSLPKYAKSLKHVHGEQDIWIHQPIRSDAALSSRASLIGTRVKRSGTVDVVKTETRDADGRLVNEQYWTGFLRDVRTFTDSGEMAPDHSVTDEVLRSAPLAKVSQTIDKGQTYRYAEASGDHTAYHVDNDVARSMGFADGIIVHGLCTMAFLSWAVVNVVSDGDPTRLRRIAVRFSKPLVPGQTVSTSMWSAGERNGRSAYAFEAVDDRGEAVIRRGLAEVEE